ncbi:hypothetical protein [Uliginosibacterium gangwonense]|uniref:hypothetical protein n=1 Tax=Uliginosibacterium gangwonense TaxID=392736 RepID=UPI00036A6338|nr:hypothetical protein [Uliginosibacterium gangwonense]
MAHRLLLVVLAVVVCGVSAAEQPPRGGLILHNEAAINEAVREQQGQNHERIRQLRQDLRREVDRNNDQKTDAAPHSGQARQTWREPPGNGAGNASANGKGNEQVTWSDRQPPRLQRLSPEERSRLREDVRGFWNDRGGRAQSAPRR